MAIYAHEGLPRSGKSYESAVFVIIPALKNGRTVWAYIEGLNHAMFAEFAGITVDRCKELLIQLEYDDVRQIPKRSIEESWKDGLIVIDEIQDFYPSGTQKLDQVVSKFVTQHGHDGLDILIMGQSMSDVHTLWRNRINQKTQFLKLEALGKENTYRWTTFNGVLDNNGRIKFNKINEGKRDYDTKYFGIYKSHNAGTLNTDNHLDERANIYSTSLFKVLIPGFGIIICFALYYLYIFFTDSSLISNGSIEQKKTTEKHQAADEFAVQKKLALGKSEKHQPKSKPEVIPEIVYIDYVDEIANDYRPRLVGLIHSQKKKIGIIEFLDGSFRVKEKLDFEQLQDMGWSIKIKVNYVILSKEKINFTVTSWPIESSGRVSEYKQRELDTSRRALVADNSSKNYQRKRMVLLKSTKKVEL